MITYTTKKIKSDKYFTKAEEVIKYINEFGTIKFNGKRLSIVMKSDNLTEIMKLDKVKDDITVLTTDSIISKIQMVSNAKVNPSKLDLIKKYIDTYNVTIQGKKVMSYLLKIVDDTDIDGSMDALCKKCNNIITEDIILSNFVVANYIHPINNADVLIISMVDLTKIDEKWNKRLNEMNEIKKKNQEKFEQIKKRVKDEEMKEYIFQPKINTSKNKNTKNNNSLNNNDTNNIKKKHKRTGSAIITNRLYNDDLLKRKENKENLIKKYTPTFQPKIDEKSKNMKLNRRKNEYMYRYILFNKTNYDCHNYSYERSNGQSYTNTQWNIHNKLDDSEYEKSEDYILDDENNNNKKYKNYNHNIEIQEIDEEQIDDLNLNKDEINDNIIENKNNE